MGIRAYLDTNLYISFLLKPGSSGPPSTIVRAGLQRRFTLLFGDPTIQEILHKSTNKPYLSERITDTQVDSLLQTMEEIGDYIRSAPTVISAMSRDRKDDYLLTYSEVGQATHLVTGDNDLLELEHDVGFQIMTPAAFVALLDAGTSDT